ncbi:MAG: PAS domain S-box protein [Acidobacteria bacterium]|nr:PAS domain S-box protein [Acidobacteriota bacterium]
MPAHTPASPAKGTDFIRPATGLGGGARLAHHVFAIGITAAAILLHRLVLFRVTSEPAPIILIVPIILSAYLGGLGPGLSATACAAVGSILFLFPPAFEFSISRPVDQIRWVTLVVGGVLISVMSEWLHRSRAGAAAREKEYRLVVENVSDVVWVFDLESRRFRYVSPSVERLRGYTADEVMAQEMQQAMEWLSRRDVERVLADRLAAFRSGDQRSYTDETEQAREDGRAVWTETVTRYARNPETGHIEVYGTSRDIDVRKRAELALEASNERYRSLFVNMLEGYSHCRMLFEGDIPVDFVYLTVNPAFEKLTGLKDVLGRKVSELIPGIRDTNPELFEIYGRVARGGGAERYETQVDALGSWYSISVYGAGKDQFVSVFDNITERKRVQEALRVNEARLRLANDAANAGVWEWDLGTGKNYWSDELWELYGVEPHSCEPSYEAWLQTIWPEDRISVARAVHEAALDGAELNAEWRVPDGKGRTRWLMSRGQPVRGASGQVASYIGIVLDITGRKRTEAALRELNASLEQRVAERTRDLVVANRELESFSYSVSHDLRAPLRAIDGFARGLAEDYRELLGRDGRDYLDRVIAAAGRMGQLIDDLLSLSRITRQELSRQPVDLSGMVRSIAGELGRGEPTRAVEFQIEDGVIMDGDPRLLRILLENLLGNAFKFTANRPVARIEFGAVSDSQGRSVCYVRDNGAGFDMSYAHKLFGAFQRLHSLREFPGTGIGLATVQRIINRHSGRVWAEARLDEGATFYFVVDGRIEAENGQTIDGRESDSIGGGQSGR